MAMDIVAHDTMVVVVEVHMSGDLATVLEPEPDHMRLHRIHRPVHDTDDLDVHSSSEQQQYSNCFLGNRHQTAPADSGTSHNRVLALFVRGDLLHGTARA